MKKHLLFTTTVAVAFGLSGLTGAAAQTEEEENVIIVSGIKASIKSSLAAKKESTSIVDAISAEDIGKLPDASIAESLARLPGVAAQRTAGRARGLSIRGLGPDFSSTLLNGREQVTSGDDRGVEFDQYPSELLNQVLVYKTSDASLVASGVSGTADMRSVRPLEVSERVVALNAKYEWNEYGALNAGSDETGYRVTGFYADKTADERRGLMLSVATQSSPTQAERWDAWGYPTTGGGELVLGGAKPYVESRDLDRTAFAGTLQFAPDDYVTMTLDAFYSDYEDQGILRGIEFPLAWSGATLQPGYTIENGLVTQGQFNGVVGVVRNDVRSRKAELSSLGFNVEAQVAENWTLTGDIAHSSMDRKDRDLETYSGTGFNQSGASDNLGFSATGDGGFTFTSGLDYTDPSLMLLTDPQGWGQWNSTLNGPDGERRGQAGFIKEPAITDELTSLRLDAERELDHSIFSSVEFGVNFTDRSKTKRSEESFLVLPIDAAARAINPADESDQNIPIPSQYILGSTNLGFLGIPGMISYNPNALFADGIYEIIPNNNADVIVKAWDVHEQVITYYGMLNIDTALWDKPLTGNFGVQYVDTEQSSRGPALTTNPLNGTANIIYRDASESYGEFLPSLNLKWEIKDDTFIKFGAGRSLMRVKMEDLRASSEFGSNNAVCTNPGTTNIDPNAGATQTCLSISSGNTALQPYMGTSYDLAFEKYFADDAGNFAIGLYYKDLENWVLPGATTFINDPVFATAVLGNATLVANNPELAWVTVTQPESVDGGWIRGLEVSTNIPGEMFLPEPFDGFGLYASYLYADSEITPGGNKIKVPGLSEHVVNTAVYYEKHGFQARVSNRYRSDFLGEVVGFGAGNEPRDVAKESVWDAQIGYTFQEGNPLEGLSVVLQGYNLSDERLATFLNDDERQVKDYQTYGATYILGVSYRF